ncbi:MAG: 6-hydroxymethylpterin diphosphokinase MptE-like protein [Nannocystaceae bacterium]
MPDLPSTARLEQLFSKDTDGLARLRRAQPTRRVSTLECAHGPVLCIDGRKLHSGRDPVREARRFVRCTDFGESSIVILLGLGSGYVARAVAHQTDVLLVVFEPDIEALREGLSHGPLPPQTLIITDALRLGSSLYRLLTASDRGQILAWKPCTRLFPNAYREAARQARLAIERARFRDLTTQVRVEGWLDFYLENLPRFREGPGLDKLRGVLNGVPAIICSAGPSLNKNVDQLRGLGERAAIFVVNTAAATLAQAGVVPHAVVSVESLDITQQLSALPWLDRVTAFLETTGHPALFELPFARRVPISVDTSACSRFTAKLNRGHEFSGGFCVANTATALAQAMGCRPIILVGQDLAYAGDRVYADGTVFEDLRVVLGDGVSEYRNSACKREIEDRSRGSLRSGIRQASRFKTDIIPAWGGAPDVTTSSDFLLFRDWFAHSAQTLRKHGIRPINATEGGARIENWDEMTLAEVVEEYGLEDETANDATENHASVRARFEAAMNAPGVSTERLIQAVTSERAAIVTMIRIGLEARALVRDDPDGDITASVATSERLARLNQELSAELHRAPLCAEALTVALDILRDRQELNTVSMHQAIEQHLATLDYRLEAVLGALGRPEMNASLPRSA